MIFILVVRVRRRWLTLSWAGGDIEGRRGGEGRGEGTFEIQKAVEKRINIGEYADKLRVIKL